MLPPPFVTSLPCTKEAGGIPVNSLRSYRIEFEHRNPEHIWNGNDDKTFLKNMGGYAVDRTT